MKNDCHLLSLHFFVIIRSHADTYMRIIHISNWYVACILIVKKQQQTAKEDDDGWDEIQTPYVDVCVCIWARMLNMLNVKIA